MLVEQASVHNDICRMISRLKNALNRRDFVLATRFKTPDPGRKYADYGQLNIIVNMDKGRGKGMTTAAVDKIMQAALGQVGLSRYFSKGEGNFDGSNLDIEYPLKSRYVQKYMTSSDEQDS